MTAPKTDNRPMIDKARHLARMSPYDFHDRPSDGLEAMAWLLGEYDRLSARVADLEDSIDRIDPGVIGALP